jgi:hypothetical protein
MFISLWCSDGIVILIRFVVTVFTKIEFILHSIYGAQTAPYSAIKFIFLKVIFKWERFKRSDQ